MTTIMGYGSHIDTAFFDVFPTHSRVYRVDSHGKIQWISRDDAGKMDFFYFPIEDGNICKGLVVESDSHSVAGEIIEMEAYGVTEMIFRDRSGNTFKMPRFDEIRWAVELQDVQQQPAKIPTPKPQKEESRVKARRLLDPVKSIVYGVSVDSAKRREKSKDMSYPYTLDLDVGTCIENPTCETISGNQWTFVCERSIDGIGYGHVLVRGSFIACLESITDNDVDLDLGAYVELVNGSLPYDAYQSTLKMYQQGQFSAARRNWKLWKERFFG